MTSVVTEGAVWIEERAAATPDAAAIVLDDRVVTFGELERLAETAAGALASLGVAAGERVALRLEPGIEFAAIVHAAHKLGAVLCPLGMRESDETVAHCLAALEPRVLVADKAHGRADAALLAPRDALNERPSPPTKARDVARDPASVHSILFTSGTDGPPKGVRQSARGHYAGAVAGCSRLEVQAHDRWIAAMPLHHVGGLSILYRSAIAGFAVILRKRFELADFDAAVRAHGASIASVVPTMLARWIEVVEADPLPSSFRCALVGGAAAAPELLARAERAGIHTASTYGLTETCAQIATSGVGEALSPAGNSGRALSGSGIEIDNASTDGVGEIVVRGPQVMLGYLGMEDAGGVHATGDLGRIDAHGNLFVVGRKDDMIVTGGENVSPSAVEAALLECAGVAEAGVTGLPDPEWGAVVAAAVVAADGAEVDPQALRRELGAKLSPHQRPKKLMIVASLERTTSGKLKRKALRARMLGAVSADFC